MPGSKHKTMLVVFSTGSSNPPQFLCFWNPPGSTYSCRLGSSKEFLDGRSRIDCGPSLCSLTAKGGREVLVFIDGKWWDALVSTGLTEADDRQAAGVMWPHYSLQCPARQRMNERETVGEGIKDRERPKGTGGKFRGPQRIKAITGPSRRSSASLVELMHFQSTVLMYIVVHLPA